MFYDIYQGGKIFLLDNNMWNVKLLLLEYLQSKNYLVGRKKLFLSQLIFM